MDSAWQAVADVLGGSDVALRRSSTAEQAADAVRSLVLHHALPAGAPLRETQLAAALGISRNTMREALRMLAREGLVVQTRHRVATVAALDANDVTDTYAVRRLLEFGAVDLIAARVASGARLDFGAIGGHVQALRRIGDSEWHLIIDADCAFHAELVTLASSPRLAAAYAQLEAEIRRSMSVSTRSHRDRRELYQEHSDLLGFLRAGRYEEFKERLGATLDVGEADILRVLLGGEDPPRTPDRFADPDDVAAPV
jgi:DNA-binding GntR family transcriptional regulator